MVYDDKRRGVAEIKRKEAVGGLVCGVDVFRLIVHEPGSRIESAVAMALVIVLEQKFGSSSYSPRALHLTLFSRRCRRIQDSNYIQP